MEDGLSPQQRRARAADWIQPPEEEAGLRRYLQTLRERIWIVIAAVVVTTGIAIVYVVTADKVYEAEADLLITPVSSTDAVPISLPGLIPESSDPTRDVATASRLVENVDVAAARQDLAELLPEPPEAPREGDGGTRRLEQHRRRQRGGGLARGGRRARQRLCDRRPSPS